MKTCLRCRTPKPLDDFHRNKNVKDGRSKVCKICCSKYGKRYYVKNKEKILQQTKAYRDSKTIDERREWDFKKKYGITVQQYKEMFQRQGGGCKICGQPASRLHVDHDHTTEAVRGLLCSNCNRGLGCFLDDPQLLEKASWYLKTAS